MQKQRREADDIEEKATIKELKRVLGQDLKKLGNFKNRFYFTTLG